MRRPVTSECASDAPICTFPVGADDRRNTIAGTRSPQYDLRNRGLVQASPMPTRSTALTRRRFLGSTVVAAAAASVAPAVRPLAGPERGLTPGGRGLDRIPVLDPGEDVTTDERYWESVQQAFNVDRSLVHLNSGGVCPSPEFVQRAEEAHRLEANRRPFYAHQAEIGPQIESVRRGISELFGCDSEEVALTRNTSEGMEIVQLGVRLERGDEILTTRHDYPRMLQTWRQRAAREGIVIRYVDVPVPLADPGVLVDRFAQSINDRTRLVMCCHMVDLTGQVLPVRAISDTAHRRNIPVLVDGAQTFGHFDFRQQDLACDFFATSLHKWMCGPQGTGMLYVKRERIPDVWPLMPADRSLDRDIRKFEDRGTHPPAPFLALGEAIAFHRTIGAERKARRLRHLRDYWLGPIARHDRVREKTHAESALALATVDVDGIEPVALRDYLWTRHRIRVRPIDQSGVRGIRVSPGIYTTLAELDRFVHIMERVVRNGIPT